MVFIVDCVVVENLGGVWLFFDWCEVVLGVCNDLFRVVDFLIVVVFVGVN